jgi:transcriptional regulator with XRE-family HTH domain
MRVEAVLGPALNEGARQLTVETIAFEADMAARHWAQIEAGKANPTLTTLVKSAVARGVTIGDLCAPVQR